MNPLDMLLANRNHEPVTGVVSSMSTTNAQCTVVVGGGGEVVANLWDHTAATAAVGVTVLLLRMGDTYAVIATRGGTGGTGASYGPELLPNNSFEYGTEQPTGWFTWPWVLGDWTGVRDTTPGEAVNGDARFLVTLKPGDAAPLVRVWTEKAVSVDPGVTYTVSAWVKAPAGDASLSVDAALYTAPTDSGANPFGTGLSIATVATVVNPGAAYQALTGPVTIPAGHKFARLYLSALADATIPAPVTVSWDLPSLRQRITS